MENLNTTRRSCLFLDVDVDIVQNPKLVLLIFHLVSLTQT